MLNFTPDSLRLIRSRCSSKNTLRTLMTMCDGARFGTPLNRASVSRALRSSSGRNTGFLSPRLVMWRYSRVSTSKSASTFLELIRDFFDCSTRSGSSCTAIRSVTEAGTVSEFCPSGTSVSDDDGTDTFFISSSGVTDGITAAPVNWYCGCTALSDVSISVDLID